MSVLPCLSLSLTDDDHVLRLMSDLIQWDKPDCQSRARAFFLPEDPGNVVLEAVFAPLRAVCRLVVRHANEGLADAQVLISRRGEVNAAMLDRSPNVSLVQRLGERRKGLDIPACHARGIEVSLLPRRSLDHVADHTMMLILAAARRLPAMQAGLRNFREASGAPGYVSYNWPAVGGIQALSGLTLGVVGLGEIGLRVARRASAFGMSVVWTAQNGVRAETESSGWRWMALPALLREADIVTLHVPPAGLTGPLIGQRELSTMKPGAILINTARGALVDSRALADALRSGRLAGAALDVHAAEPIAPDDPLLSLPDAILTPHVAGGSRQVVLHELSAICDNLVDSRAGLPPRHARVLA